VIGSRTRSRELALQALYTYDVDPSRDRDVITQTLRDAEVNDEVRRHAESLVYGTLDRLGEIDKLIRGAADNWDLERLAVVDRNVLRLALHELLDRDDVPAAVVLDEAIELGKRFSTKQSGAFINGLLDRLRKDMGLDIPARALEALEGDDQARSLDPSGPPAPGDDDRHTQPPHTD